MAETIQTNIFTNDKNYANFSYFLGGIDVTDQNLNQFTPYIQGVSRIFLHKAPYFMEKVYSQKTKNFKSLIETGYTRIDGIGDIDVEFTEFEGGFNGDKFSTVAKSTDNSDSLTISVYEQSGSPVREYIDTWITGVRDPRTGIAHYHGAIKDGSVIYGEKNHTAEFIYITMDPTGQHIEYACMFASAFPTKVSKSHLNYEKGQRDNVSMDLEFRCKKYESPAINAAAAAYLAASQVEYNYLAFDPNITNKINATNYGFGSNRQ